MAIGGRDVTRWRTEPAVMPLSRHFERAAGTPIHLTIERGGERRLIEAVLRDILAPGPAPGAAATPSRRGEGAFTRPCALAPPRAT